MDAQAIAAANVPVLCFDTCSILDIMRDPTRDTAKPHDRQAALALLAAAESGRIVCLMAEQVAIEFAEHDKAVQEEAERNLKKVRDQIMRINMLSGIYGAPGVIDLSHLDDHVARARRGPAIAVSFSSDQAGRIYSSQSIRAHECRTRAGKAWQGIVQRLFGV